VVIILVGEGDITYRRNAIFSDAFSLWYDNIEKYPNLSRPHSNLGIIYLTKTNQQRAKGLQEFEKALALNKFDSNEAQAIQEYNLGVYYYQEGNYSQALKHSENSYKALPSYLPAAISIARIYLANNKINEASWIIEEQMKKYPNNNNLRELFTFVLFKEGKYKEAQSFAKNSLKYNTESAFLFSILAEIARSEGNLQAAIYFWKRYQESYPLDSAANLALIDMYFQTNQDKLLDEEIAKLYCLKSNQTLLSYVKTFSNNRNFLVYVPEYRKIENIIGKRKKYF
jgi:predicted Zn-dependent protease